MANSDYIPGSADLLRDSYSKKHVQKTLIPVASDIHKHILDMLQEIDVLRHNNKPSKQKELVTLSGEIIDDMHDLVDSLEALLDNDTFHNAMRLGTTISNICVTYDKLHNLICEMQKERDDK